MVKYSVFIGRFQPCHHGHISVMRKALAELEGKLIVVIGSSGGPRTTRNPLTAQERVEIIKSFLNEQELERIVFSYVPDFMYNDNQWIASVQQAVFSAIHRSNFIAGPVEITLVGMKKDMSSYYLDLFPTWKSLSVAPALVNGKPVSSTDIRDKVLGEGYNDPRLVKFIPDVELEKLKSDYKYEKEYEGKWGFGPHYTADALVVQSGHILLIRRGREYGQGQWALPGGFVNRNETSFEGAIRELYEETKLKVPEKVVRGSTVRSQVFDHPNRSLRARIITNAFYFQLASGELPKVRGSDDAEIARWVPLAQAKTMRHSMFEDHHDIISSLTGAF